MFFLKNLLSVIKKKKIKMLIILRTLPTCSADTHAIPNLKGKHVNKTSLCLLYLQIEIVYTFKRHLPSRGLFSMRRKKESKKKRINE